MKVLIVEDDPETVEVIKLCLSIRWANAEVMAVGNGSEVAHLVEMESPDVDGLNVLQEVRRFSSVPVIIVTARGGEIARINGLELGADDYIVKPFYYTELLARVKAVLRRTRTPEFWSNEAVVSGNGLTIDFKNGVLKVDGKEVKLTLTEWNLLSYFVRNQGKLVSHEVLAEKVWGAEFRNDPAIRMCVRRLRMKLGDDPQSPRIIHSHRGIGYRFVMPN